MHSLKPALALVLLLCVAGVGAQQTGAAGQVETRAEPAPVRDAAIRYISRPRTLGEAEAGSEAEEEADPQPRIIRGNDVVIRPPGPAPRPLRGEPAGLKFEDAPIVEVVRVVLGEIVKADYVIHPPLAGTVTLSTNAPVPIDHAVLLLESALQANGIVMARDQRGVFHVGVPDAVRGIVPTPRRVGSGPLPPGHGSIIVPLQFIGAAEMAEILRPMAPGDAILRVDNLRNLLILAGSRTQIEGWLDLVATFDIDLLAGMSVGVFPLKYISVSEVEAAMALMSGGGAAAAAAAPTARTAPATGAAPAGRDARIAAAAAAAAAAAGTSPTSGGSHPLFGAVRIMPIERLNSILVVTPRAAYLDQARAWIERLDQPSENDLEPQLFLYPVQNGNASHLASVLNGIFGGEASGTGQASTDPGIAPGLRGTTGGTTGGAFGGGFGGASGVGGIGASGASGISGSFGGGGRGAAAAGVLNQLGQGGAAPGVTTVSFGQRVRVIADELNNAILIYGPRSDYKKIEAALRRLDLAPTQVLIEASILEVTLTDELRYGLNWFFQNNLGSGRTGLGQLTRGAPVTDASNRTQVVSPINPGFSFSLVNSAGTIRAVLTALAEKSLLNVISTPSIMVLDNHTAVIQVGDQQPVRSSETVTDGGNTTTSIQYKDTGVMLAVTPSVSAGDSVSMFVNQNITDVGDIDTATQQRSFLQRSISSRVSVRSGESVVLGGLIRDNTTRGRQGLPLLSDIPIVGGLFGSTNLANRRTELMIVITPRVVRSDQDMRDVTQELRGRMRGLEALEVLRTQGRPQTVPALAPTTVTD